MFRHLLICITITTCWSFELNPLSLFSSTRDYLLEDEICLTNSTNEFPGPENLEVTSVSSSEIYIYWGPTISFYELEDAKYIVVWVKNESEEECGSLMKDSDMYAANIMNLESDTLYDIYVAYGANETDHGEYAYVTGKTTSMTVTVRPSLLITAYLAMIVSFFSIYTSSIA